MTFTQRAARAIKGFLNRNSPEFAVLDVTRDEAILTTDETGQPITPAGISSMWRAKGPSGKRTRMRVTAWVIANYDTMRDGNWPDVRPEEIPTHGGFFKHAPHEMPCIYAAIVSRRVYGCGEVGLMCWAYYNEGFTLKWLAGKYSMTEQDVCKCINQVLDYCATWTERRRSFKDWKNRNYKMRKCQESQRS